MGTARASGRAMRSSANHGSQHDHGRIGKRDLDCRTRDQLSVQRVRRRRTRTLPNPWSFTPVPQPATASFTTHPGSHIPHPVIRIPHPAIHTPRPTSTAYAPFPEATRDAPASSKCGPRRLLHWMPCFEVGTVFPATKVVSATFTRKERNVGHTFQSSNNHLSRTFWTLQEPVDRRRCRRARHPSGEKWDVFLIHRCREFQACMTPALQVITLTLLLTPLLIERGTDTGGVSLSLYGKV